MTVAVSSSLPPGPRGYPLIGSLPLFLFRDPLETTLTALREHGDVVRFHAGPLALYLVNHPDHIRYVLQENRQNYTKSLNYDELRFVVGNGLLTSEGDFWQRQRRLAQPAFHHKRLAALAAAMADEVAAMLDRWSQYATTGVAFDVAPELMRATLAIAGRTLFGAAISRADADAVARALAVVLPWANDRTLRLVRLPPTLPSPANVRAQRAVRALDSVVYGILDARRKDPDAGGSDLLAMLLEARDERSGKGMTDRQLRDEVMTLLLAGHETTAVLLTWAFYLLSLHPAVERALHAEVTEVLGGRTPTFEDLPRLRYTLMVVEETLRLYPPAWWIERQALREDEIGGYAVPPGAIVAVVPYAMHRHPAYWDNPEGFDPERFSPERAADRPKFAYVPFGGGPRVCIGNHFALMEAQLVLAMAAQRYRLDLVPGHPVEPEPAVTLRARRGVRVTLAARADMHAHASRERASRAALHRDAPAR